MAVARITGPGQFYRLREAEGWLAELLARVLDEGIAERRRGLEWRMVDATVINGPGRRERSGGRMLQSTPRRVACGRSS